MGNPSVTHQHTVSNVLSDELLEKMTTSVNKLAYIWTRIGIGENDGRTQINELQGRLAMVIDTFVNDQEAEYQRQCMAIRQLQSQIEDVLQDLAVLLSEEDLAHLIARPSGSKHLSGCLREQRAYLQSLHQNLKDQRSQRMEHFLMLKGQLNGFLHQLGLNAGDIDPQCASILSARVVNHEETRVLQEISQQYGTLLEQRKACWEELSSKVISISRLVPLQIDEDYLSNDGNNPKLDLVFSEDNLAKLKQLYDNVQQSALHIWGKLTDAFVHLQKLYDLFEVSPRLRHSYFVLIDATMHSTDESPLSETELPPLDLFQEENVTLTEAQQQLEDEWKHYALMKKERVVELIGVLRKQFQELLSECLVSPQLLVSDVRYQFLFLEDDNQLNEALLSQHETELERLREYHQVHRSILSQVAKWRALNEELKNCEQQLQSSLSKNRGGVLQKILTKQRVAKKLLAQSAQHITVWIEQQQACPKPAGLQAEPPFEQYTLRVEDIAREVGPTLSGAPNSARRPPMGAHNSVRKAVPMTPSFTPRVGKSKQLLTAKNKLFQSAKLKSSQLPGSAFCIRHL